MRVIGRYAGVPLIVCISASYGFVIGAALGTGTRPVRPGRLPNPRLPVREMSRQEAETYAWRRYERFDESDPHDGW